MADFRRSGGGNKGGFGGGRPSFGRPSFNKFGGGGRSGGRTEMFQATCSNCGNSCEVPFRPNGEKPVFCSPCFDKTSGRDAQPKRDSYGPKSYGERQDYGRPQERSYAPSAPIMQQAPRDTRIDNLVTQVEKLHAKIDKLLLSLVD